MNVVLLGGRWTRQPELRYTPEGVAVAWCTVAVDRPPDKSGEKSGADFFRVVMFRKTAEAVANYTDKGSKVYIQGELRNRRYTGKDGVERTVTEVRAVRVEFGSNGARREAAGEPDVFDGIYGDLGEGLDDGPLG